MTVRKILIWLRNLALALILGALGNGVWEHFLKDLLSWTFRSIANVSLFGYTFFRDSYYADIALGSGDRVGLWGVAITTYILCIMGILICIYYLSRGMNGLDEVEDVKKMAAELKRSPLISSKKMALEQAELGLKRVKSVAKLVVVLILMSFGYKFLALVYISSAINHFEHSYAICLPYIPDDQREQIRSKFAQIKTREDYISVLAELKKYAAANGLELRKFDPI